MSKPLESYERVPFRGTHYVEAAALDHAIALIAQLKAGVPQPESEAITELEENVKLLEGQLTDALALNEQLTNQLNESKTAQDALTSRVKWYEDQIELRRLEAGSEKPTNTDTDHTPQGGLPEVTGGEAQAPASAEAAATAPATEAPPVAVD